MFAIVGTTHGSGNGSTTFNLPDLRNRFVVGASASGGYNVGDTGGANSVTLSVTQIPSHNHSYSKPNTATDEYRGTPIGDNGQIGHTFGNFSTGNTGGGLAHENRPPFYALCYIINYAQGGTVAKGQKGEQGATGSGGSTGDKGQKGDKGDVEAQGSKGQKGEVGAQGSGGSTGSAGAKGQKGEAGTGQTPAIESTMRSNDTSTNSESYQTAITVTINPTVSGSKLLVVGAGIMMHYWYEDHDDPEGNQCEAILYRGNSTIGYSAVSSGPVKRQFGSGYLATGFNLTVRDSYAHNGNNVTYYLKFRRYGNNGNGFVKIQRGTTLTVQEII